MNDENGQELLKQIIVNDLTKTSLNTDKQTIIEKLKRLYNKEYRHRYSDITDLIFSLIKNKTDEEASELLLTISQNLRVLQNDKDLNEVKTQIAKLYDHINLECIRMSYYMKQLKEINDKLSQNKTTFAELSKLKQQLNAQQTQYIAILGIFASIVLTFFGGFVFSNSIFANIDKVSIYRLSFVMCFIMCFFGNMLYAIFKNKFLNSCFIMCFVNYK